MHCDVNVKPFQIKVDFVIWTRRLITVYYKFFVFQISTDTEKKNCFSLKKTTI